MFLQYPATSGSLKRRIPLAEGWFLLDLGFRAQGLGLRNVTDKVPSKQFMGNILGLHGNVEGSEASKRNYAGSKARDEVCKILYRPNCVESSFLGVG